MRNTLVYTFSGDFVRSTFASCTFRQQLLKLLFSSGVRSAAAAKFGTLYITQSKETISLLQFYHHLVFKQMKRFMNLKLAGKTSS